MCACILSIMHQLTLYWCGGACLQASCQTRKQLPGQLSHSQNTGCSGRFAVYQNIVRVCVTLQAGCWSWKELPIQM